MSSLIYIHIGKNLPEYLYDSIYQSIIFNSKIYVILDDNLIEIFYEKISNFNINGYTKNKIEANVCCIPLSILKLPNEYSEFIDKLPIHIKEFRDSFWIHTIARFFYIENFMTLFKLKNAFHIENDVMIYENLKVIENSLDKNKLYMVKDNPTRVIASIMYLNIQEFKNLLSFILKQLQLNHNQNDMQLLGAYTSNNVEYFPMEYNSTSKYIYDSCAIGQFLGGVDPRNIQNNLSELEKEILVVNNTSKGFINETCSFKLNTGRLNIFEKKIIIDNFIIPLNLYYITDENINIKKIVNTHIHSKQLYQFSSIFNIKYEDIITGDSIISLCDFVITTNDIYNYHKNIEMFIKRDKIIIVKDFNNIDINTLNNILIECNKKVVKLFIYTHLLDKFIDNILLKLDQKLKYIIYLHNSDHSLQDPKHFQKLLDCNYIEKVYSQNINCAFNDKFSLLSIGLANSMFEHGNKLALYTTMKNTYYLNKVKNLYVNINPNTFPYRQIILDEIKKSNTFTIINKPKPFKEYLEELSKHKFSLCIRGNGIDCHRNYESLCLGVIPVIINNRYTNMNNHMVYLKALGVPFYEITDENLERYNDEFFNEELYKKIMKEYNSSIYNLNQLKLSYYSK